MLTEESYDAIKRNLSEYLTMLGEMFPTWMLHPDREQYLFRASAALQGLGSLGSLLWNKVDNSTLRKQLLSNVGERVIDWRRTNWQTWGPVIGRVVEGINGDRYVSPSSTRQTVEGTAKFLRDKSGVNTYFKDEDKTEQPGE